MTRRKFSGDPPRPPYLRLANERAEHLNEDITMVINGEVVDYEMAECKQFEPVIPHQ